MKIIYLSIILLFSVSFVSALGPVGERGISVEVKNGTINVIGYTIVQNPDGISGPLKITSNNLFINQTTSSTGINIMCNSVSVPLIINGTYNGSNETVTPGYNFSESFLKDISFTSQNFSGNQSALFCISQDQYDQCLEEKADFRSWYNTCEKSKDGMDDTSTNYTTCRESLQTANTNLQIANAAKETVSEKVTEMETAQKDAENQKWIFAVVAAGLTFVAMMIYTGKWGTNKVKTPDQEFQRGNAG